MLIRLNVDVIRRFKTSASFRICSCKKVISVAAYVVFTQTGEAGAVRKISQIGTPSVSLLASSFVWCVRVILDSVLIEDKSHVAQELEYGALKAFGVAKRPVGRREN